MFHTNSFCIILIFLWDSSLFDVDCSLRVNYFLKDDVAESTEKWAGSAISLDFSLPMVLSPISAGSRLGQLWLIHRGIRHLPPFSWRPLPTLLCCLLAKMAWLFLFSFSSVSSHKAQGCPTFTFLPRPRCPLRPMISLLRMLGLLQVGSVLPDISESCLCFQPPLITRPKMTALIKESFLIFKSYFSHVQWVSQRKVGPDALTLPSHWKP